MAFPPPKKDSVSTPPFAEEQAMAPPPPVNIMSLLAAKPPPPPAVLASAKKPKPGQISPIDRPEMAKAEQDAKAADEQQQAGMMDESQMPTPPDLGPMPAPRSTQDSYGGVISARDEAEQHREKYLSDRGVNPMGKGRARLLAFMSPELAPFLEQKRMGRIDAPYQAGQEAQGTYLRSGELAATESNTALRGREQQLAEAMIPYQQKMSIVANNAGVAAKQQEHTWDVEGKQQEHTWDVEGKQQEHTWDVEKDKGRYTHENTQDSTRFANQQELVRLKEASERALAEVDNAYRLGQIDRETAAKKAQAIQDDEMAVARIILGMAGDVMSSANVGASSKVTSTDEAGNITESNIVDPKLADRNFRVGMGRINEMRGGEGYTLPATSSDPLPVMIGGRLGMSLDDLLNQVEMNPEDPGIDLPPEAVQWIVDNGLEGDARAYQQTVLAKRKMLADKKDQERLGKTSKHKVPQSEPYDPYKEDGY